MGVLGSSIYPINTAIPKEPKYLLKIRGDGYGIIRS
jgi:hypothetical protein